MWLFLIGVLTGILGGMGIGGGTILIPTLIIFMKMNQHSAQSINLISFIPASIVALIIHHKNKNLEKGVIKNLMIPGVIAALIGSLVAVNLNAILLKRIFGVFLLIMGIFEIISQYIL